MAGIVCTTARSTATISTRMQSQPLKTWREIEGVDQRCNFIVAPVEDTGLEANSVDLVVSTDIYDMDEVVRVLKPGGRFLLSALFRLDAPSPEEIAFQHGLDGRIDDAMSPSLAQTFPPLQRRRGATPAKVENHHRPPADNRHQQRPAPPRRAPPVGEVAEGRCLIALLQLFESGLSATTDKPPAFPIPSFRATRASGSCSEHRLRQRL